MEAPIDALSLAVCGVPAAALVGTTAPAWMPAALVAKTVFLATDADPPEPDGTPGAGDRAARELDAALRLSRCVRLRPPEPWKDWNAALMGMGRNALSAWLSEYLAPPVAIPSDRPDQAAPEPVHTPGARVQIVSTGEQGRVVEVWGADDPGTVTDPAYVGRVLVRLDGRQYDTLLHPQDVRDLDTGAGCTS